MLPSELNVDHLPVIEPLKQSRKVGRTRPSPDSLIQYRFLNPRDTMMSRKYSQQIKGVQWKLQFLQLALVSRKGLILFHYKFCGSHNQVFKTSRVELIMKFCLAHHIHLAFWQQSNYCFFKHISNISQGKGGCRKCFPKVCWTPKHVFYSMEINKFSLIKMCWS